MYKFKPFLLKYLLSEDVVDHLSRTYGARAVRFDATSAVANPAQFYKLFSASDLEEYAMFGEEAIRIDVKFNGQVEVVYLFFRNGREDRPDIGANKYSFTRPSSVEMGTVDSNGAYTSFYKKHYADWFNPSYSSSLYALTEAEIKLLTKSIEYDIINALVQHFNQRFKMSTPLKPVDANGRAIWAQKI